MFFHKTLITLLISPDCSPETLRQNWRLSRLPETSAAFSDPQQRITR
jgi:hypothetical protein